jgi:transcriptional regulator with XRE-family HTH domain
LCYCDTKVKENFQRKQRFERKLSNIFSMHELAQIIKELRIKKGTQISVAARLKVVTSQQLGSYESGKYKPKADFFEAWKREYGEDIMAIQKGSNERNISNEAENGTHDKESKDNNKMIGKEINDAALGLAYKTIMEGGTEYMLIARDILRDKHRLVAIETLERDERIINRFMDENERLRLEVQRLQAKLPEVQKTQ